MLHVLPLWLTCGSLAAPAMAAKLEVGRNLLDQSNALAVRVMKAEIALVRTIRKRICPVLSQKADRGKASDRNKLTIDYQALLTCQFHQGLIGQGEHLTRRCPSWSGETTGPHSWAPEAA